MADRDWIDDEEMSADETMRRFAALRPSVTVGPRGADQHGGGLTFGDGALHVSGLLVRNGVRVSFEPRVEPSR